MKERSDIQSILSGFQKYEIMDFGTLYGADITMDMKKAEMVNQLTYYLVTKPDEWLLYLTERDLRLLEELVAAGPDRKVEMDFSDYPSVLEASGLVDKREYDDYDLVWLRREVYDIVAPHLPAAIKAGESSHQFEIERLMLGYLNLYGVMPYSLLYDKVYEYVESHMIPHDIVFPIMETSSLLKLARFDLEGDDTFYLASPFLVDPVKLMDDRGAFGVDGYAEFSEAQALEAGMGAPFCTFGLKSSEGKALVAMLRKLRYEEDYLDREEHDIWMNSQYVDDENAFEEMFGAVSDVRGELTESRYRSYLQVIADYANVLPKWVLCGHSSLETGYLSAALDFDESDDDFDLSASPSGPQHWTMPRPTISEGYTDVIESDESLDHVDKLMPHGFPFGMAIPHVAPDDPCPCGSGLTYRRCHGKRLS